jgi:hypothetical protein
MNLTLISFTFFDVKGENGYACEFAPRTGAGDRFRFDYIVYHNGRKARSGRSHKATKQNAQYLINLSKNKT